MSNIMEKLELTAQSMYCKKVEELTPSELHLSLGKAVMGEIADNWAASKAKHNSERRAYYFSAEFLMGRMMYNNLYCLGILEDVKKMLKKKGVDINVFEDEGIHGRPIFRLYTHRDQKIFHGSTFQNSSRSRSNRGYGSAFRQPRLCGSPALADCPQHPAR